MEPGLIDYANEGYRKGCLGSVKPLSDFDYPNAFEGVDGPIPAQAIYDFHHSKK